MVVSTSKGSTRAGRRIATPGGPRSTVSGPSRAKRQSAPSGKTIVVTLLSGRMRPGDAVAPGATSLRRGLDLARGVAVRISR